MTSVNYPAIWAWNRRRAVFSFALLAAFCCHAQDNTGSSQSLECFDLLRIPRYPPLARAARLTGTAHVLVAVDSRGSVASIQIKGVHNILRDEVKKSIQESRVSPNCGRPRMELVFVFTIGGQPTDSKDPGQISFKWPNQFIVSVRPAVPEPATNAPAAGPRPRSHSNP